MGMMKVVVKAFAPADILFRLGREVSSTPEVFPNIESLRVLEHSEDKNFMKAEWTAHARVLTLSKSMSWIQEDHWDEERMRCRFFLSPDHRGHIKRFSGFWSFKPMETFTEMIMETDFHLKHPIVTPHVHKLVELVLKRNNEALLREIKKRGEALAKSNAKE